MHFGEMDHLPYRHARFMPSSSMVVLQINSFLSDGRFEASSCFSYVALHDHFLVPICGDTSLVGGFFNPSLGYLFLGEGFSHMVFSLSSFLEVAFLYIFHGYLTWPHCQDPFYIS